MEISRRLGLREKFRSARGRHKSATSCAGSKRACSSATQTATFMARVTNGARTTATPIWSRPAPTNRLQSKPRPARARKTGFIPAARIVSPATRPQSGGVLGVKTRQLNGNFKYPNGVTDNQLSRLVTSELFDDAFDDRKISRLPAPRQPHEHRRRRCTLRVRSYLDANCAMCHRPGGASAFFDARFDTPLKKQNLINGPVANQLGIAGAKVIVPGDTNKSILFRRISIIGENQMPPLARNRGG